MPPKRKAKDVQAEGHQKVAIAVPNSVFFPSLSSKSELGCRVLLEDQIFVIDNLLLPVECKQLTEVIDNLPLELTPPKRKGEADRFNYRLSVSSVTFAQELYKVILPHLSQVGFPRPSSTKEPPADVPRRPHSLNSNIRMYKYTPEQYFGDHYDDSVRDPATGAQSEWTLLIYLTGIEDGVLGGETVFHQVDRRGNPVATITAPLTRGTALLHRHGRECLLHGGSKVIQGTKYVLRSDLMFNY